jgi:hypothetical protein
MDTEMRVENYSDHYVAQHELYWTKPSYSFFILCMWQLEILAKICYDYTS